MQSKDIGILTRFLNAISGEHKKKLINQLLKDFKKTNNNALQDRLIDRIAQYYYEKHGKHIGYENMEREHAKEFFEHLSNEQLLKYAREFESAHGYSK